MNEDIVKQVMDLRNAVHIMKSSKIFKHHHSDLKHAEKHLIFMIYNSHDNKALKPTELAKKMGVTLPAISHQINTLEKKGYITRVPDVHDKRISFVKLTEKGEQLNDELNEKFLKKIEGVVEYLGEDDSREILRIAKRIVEYKEGKQW